MKIALNAYRHLLDDNLAFTYGLFGMFDVEFQAKTKEGLRRLQVWDVANQELLKPALSLVQKILILQMRLQTRQKYIFRKLSFSLRF